MSETAIERDREIRPAFPTLPPVRSVEVGPKSRA